MTTKTYYCNCEVITSYLYLYRYRVISRHKTFDLALANNNTWQALIETKGVKRGDIIDQHGRVIN
jgi:hypothetical protein